MPTLPSALSRLSGGVIEELIGMTKNKSNTKKMAQITSKTTDNKFHRLRLI